MPDTYFTFAWLTSFLTFEREVSTWNKIRKSKPILKSLLRLTETFREIMAVSRLVECSTHVNWFSDSSFLAWSLLKTISRPLYVIKNLLYTRIKSKCSIWTFYSHSWVHDLCIECRWNKRVFHFHVCMHTSGIQGFLWHVPQCCLLR